MGCKGNQVLMVTLAMQGHMNPMLKFAKVLVSKGLNVTIATNDAARKRLPNSKISETSSCSSKERMPEIRMEFFSDGLGQDFDRDGRVDEWITSLKTEGSRNLSNLMSNLTDNGENKSSCVIINPFVPWATQVAAEHNMPCAILWIQASATFSIYYHHAKNPNLFPDLENLNETVELPGLPVLEVRDLPTFMLPSSPYHFRALILETIQSLDYVNWVLGSSVYELEEKIVKSMAKLKPIFPIGPLVSPFLLGKEDPVRITVDLRNAENSCLEWLDKQPSSSVIYIAFGSLLSFNQNQMDSIATALKKVKSPFLWVVSETKGVELPPGFLEETGERGLVVSWCPQEKVLMHKASACFMTHCGWNSTLETIVAGLPVIAYPTWTDQPTDAKLLVDVFKIGVRMRNGEDGSLSPEEVEKCILEIAKGPKAAELRKRALVLKEAARKALEEGGSSTENINRFINEISFKN